MAKANGILKIEGTVEDLTFFKLGGKSFVRKKGGVSKERIETDPSFVRTRENNSEFSLCAGSGRLLRMGLGSLVFKAKDSRLTSRLLQTLYRVKQFDTVSQRGRRNVSEGIATAGGKLALSGFDFNVNAPLNSVLFAPYFLELSVNSLTIKDLIPLEQLRYPQGATHVSFQLAGFGINFETEETDLVLSNTENVALSMTANDVVLLLASLPVTTGVSLYLLSVSFFQEVNGVQYSLNNEEFSVLQVIEVV
jgi:hypothetical protein